MKRLKSKPKKREWKSKREPIEAKSFSLSFIKKKLNSPVASEKSDKT